MAKRLFVRMSKERVANNMASVGVTVCLLLVTMVMERSIERFRLRLHESGFVRNRIKTAPFRGVVYTNPMKPYT